MHGNNGSVAKNSQHGSAEASYQPPVTAVRIAKAAFAAAGRATQEAEKRGFVQVLFDSFLQRWWRERGPAEWKRQMLYRADPYQIDVQIEAKPGAMAHGHWTIAGRQLAGVVAATRDYALGSSREFHPYDDESVWRVSRRDRKHWRFGAFVSRKSENPS